MSEFDHRSPEEVAADTLRVRRQESIDKKERRIEQLEALLREAVDLAFNNSEQTCQYCNADSKHDDDCLVTKANELLNNR